MKKSPGWVNRGEAVSSLLPYVYTASVSFRHLRKAQRVLTEVCIEYDSQVWSSNQERREESPYLWQKSQKIRTVKDHQRAWNDLGVDCNGENESSGSQSPALHQHQHKTGRSDGVTNLETGGAALNISIADMIVD